MNTPERSGPAQRLICPMDNASLSQISSTQEGSQLVSRTYVCSGLDGHVWVEATGADGLRAWTLTQATMVPLL